MKRYLFHILSAVSLLLCVAMVVLWVRSYSSYDVYSRSRDRFREPQLTIDTRGILTASGRLIFLRNHAELVISKEEEIRRFGTTAEDNVSWGHRQQKASSFPIAQFGGDSSMRLAADSVGFPFTTVTIPFWLLTILLAVLPSMWAMTYSRRRIKHNRRFRLCIKCGYDLRAHKPNEKCPECGTSVSATATGVGSITS